MIWRVICLSSGAVQPSGKVQLEIKRTNANISVSRGKCTIFTRIAFLHFLKRAVDQYNGDLFNMSNRFFLFSNLEVAPMWLWGFRHGANMIMALMQYFSQLSQVFLWYVKHICADVIARKQTWRRYDCYVAPIWQCYVLLGIATWRRYDWHLACENRQYRKIWQIYQVLVLLFLYTLYWAL